MLTLRSFSPSMLVTLALLALAPSPAAAVPQPCPQLAIVWQCVLDTPNASIGIVASNIDGGELRVEFWTFDGESHIFRQFFKIYDIINDEFPDFTLTGVPMFDPDTQQMTAQYLEDNGAILVTATMTFSETGDVGEVGNQSILDEEIRIESFVNGLSGRFYAVNEFRVGAAPLDDIVTATPGGAVITQIDDLTNLVDGFSATVHSITPPTSFQTGTISALDLLILDIPLELDGTTETIGPAGLASALAWDRALNDGDTTVIRMRKTLNIPEPGPSIGLVIGAFALMGLHRRR